MTQENQKKEILSQIIHGTPIPTFVIDRQHRITHCNKAYERLAGAPLEEIIGSPPRRFAKRLWLADFIVDGAAEKEIASYYGSRYRRSPSVEGAYEAEEFFPAIGDKGRWLYFTAAPLMDDEGKVIGAIETLQDVTERKTAEEAVRKSGRRFRAMLDFAPYPVVVFTLEGLVSYLNPAFTETFGWTLKELEGRNIPYAPPGSEQETREHIRMLLEQKVILRRESKRFTRDGRLLNVILREVVFSEPGETKPSGVMVILRDVTQERRIARQNEAMLRISMALPRYPDLEDVLDYINSEVKDLLGTEGSVVVLLDEHKEELFVLGAAYDDTETQERIKEIRFSMDQLIAGRVIRSGEP
ncbi:MAG: histidine kinase, partial [Deltaproteobacteria bacterium HGW-Deltaproteobacteria-15]